MDLAQATAIATPVLCLLSEYLAKVGEGALGGFGKKVGEDAFLTAKDLYANVRQLFSKTPQTSALLANLERSPKDTGYQAEARSHLAQMVVDHPDLAPVLTQLLTRADQAGADAWFKTSIHGDVQKLVQIGVVHGNVNL